jgi:2-(1,2-epoxy-1,2-dihydrophenyl)acetyl-CoA isomerase
LTLLNPTLTAQQALDWGLITRVVDDADLDAQTAEMASGLASGPTLTLGAAKRLMRQSATNGLETQMDYEAREIARASLTTDGREGVDAFLTKRAAVYTGK